MSTLRRGILLLFAATGLVVLATIVAMLSSTTIGSALAERVDGARNDPTIYGHRGAVGYRPEHTLASYRLAARIGAESNFLSLELRSSANAAEDGNAITECQRFFVLGVDGVFSDTPDSAKAARDDE